MPSKEQSLNHSQPLHEMSPVLCLGGEKFQNIFRVRGAVLLWSSVSHARSRFLVSGNGETELTQYG